MATMKKLIIIFLLVCFPAVLAAQDNPYHIDQECYKYMVRADALIGKPGFQEQADSLLAAAREKGDSKAEVIYYVECLRDLCHRPDSSEEEVLQAHETLKKHALASGYRQYYYQSYQTTKNYFFNKEKTMNAMDLMREVHAFASAENDEYGRWFYSREMSTFYLNYSAGKPARRHLRSVMDIRHSTDDPTILRQSLSSLYLDYSKTFQPDTDSAVFYVNKARETANTPIDSVRCWQELAIISAVDCDRESFRTYMNLIETSPHRQAISRWYPQFFNAAGNLLDGNVDAVDKSLYDMPLHLMTALSMTAAKLGYHSIAEELKDRALAIWSGDIEDFLEMNLAEMDALYRNDVLSTELAEKTRLAQRITIAVAALIVLLLATVMVFLLVHIRKLQEANDKVRIADEAKTRFLQNMTHEIRTPLNAITGFSQLLSLPDGTFPAEEKEDFCSHVVNNTKILTMLLDDIINTSAIDTGNYSVSMERGDCQFICREAIASSEHRLQPGVSMSFVQDFEGEHSFVTDPRRVQQILINLLTNACKYTSKGSIVLGCSLKEHPGNVTFWVEDTGSGIPAEDAERIFQRFTKLDEFVQGTGLGLSICRDLADKLDGKVFLDTSYQGGARFVFFVPDRQD